VKSPDGTEWLSWDRDPDGDWLTLSWRKDEPGQPGPWELWRRDPDHTERLISIEFPDKDFHVIGAFPSTTPPPTQEPLPNLRIDGRDWKNSDVLYVPRWVDMLSALRPDRSVDDWTTFATWAVSTGFTGVRVFAGALPWANQTPVSARQRLPELLDVLASFGLACEITAVTESGQGYDWRDHLRQVESICIGRMGVVLEGANEIGHPTQASDLTVKNIVAVLNGSQTIWAPGAIMGVDEAIDNGHYPGRGGKYCTAHLDRGRDFWNQCRRVRELYGIVEADGVPCLDNEPLGAAEQADPGKRENDPAFFATLGVLDRAFRGVGGVHHSTAGLDVKLPGPMQQACADAYVQAHRIADECLQGQTGAYYNSGHQNSPVGAYPPQVFESYLCRHYAFTHGTRGVSAAIGVVPWLALNWANGWQPVAQRAIWTRAADGKQLQIWEIAK
jgi:hypothetical protein